MRNTFKLTMIYIGTMIGAGFASGQEVISFFVKNGSYSWIGIMLCSVTMGIFAYISLEISRKRGQMRASAPTNNLSTIICTIFLLCGFTAMSAGAGALLQQLSGLHTIIGIVIFLAITALILMRKSKGVVLLNTYLTPLIIIGIIATCVYVFLNPNQAYSPPKTPDKWLIPSLVYASYNLLSIIPVFSNLSELATTRKINITTSIISATITCVLLLLMWNILSNNYNTAEIPIIAGVSNVVKMIYAPIMLFAMLTTAVSGGFALMETTKLQIWHLIFISLAVSILPFSKIVSVGYSICGYIGFIVLLQTAFKTKNVFQTKNEKVKTKN